MAYYKDLWEIVEKDIDHQIVLGTIKLEERPKALAYYKQWFDYPGWAALRYNDKIYYRSYEGKIVYWGLWAFAVFMGLITISMVALLIWKHV